MSIPKEVMTLEDVRAWHINQEKYWNTPTPAFPEVAQHHQEMADVIDVHISNHAVMVAKLRELSKDCNDSALTLGVEGLRGQCIEASKTIRSILSTEPAMRSANATDAQTEVKK